METVETVVIVNCNLVSLLFYAATLLLYNGGLKIFESGGNRPVIDISNDPLERSTMTWHQPSHGA